MRTTWLGIGDGSERRSAGVVSATGRGMPRRCEGVARGSFRHGGASGDPAGRIIVPRRKEKGRPGARARSVAALWAAVSEGQGGAGKDGAGRSGRKAGGERLARGSTADARRTAGVTGVRPVRVREVGKGSRGLPRTAFFDCG